MGETRTVLVEVHCEEIPARFLRPLAEEFENAFATFSDQNKLATVDAHGTSNIHCESFYSPRKLAWRFSNLVVRQDDQTETQVGPPQRMCVDGEGQPILQGLKFAEKWGVGFEAVRFEQPAGKKEPCAVVTLTKAGRPTLDLLAEALPKLIGGLHVPKAMRWGRSEFTFVRPIRNLLCRFGTEVVPFEVDGIRTCGTTLGHRLFHLQHPEPVVVASPEAYEAALEAAGIVVSFEQRRDLLAHQLADLAQLVGGTPTRDEELLDTLALIV